MHKFNDGDAAKKSEIRQVNRITSLFYRIRKRKIFFLPDILIIVAMSILLCLGASRQLFYSRSDVAKYECYAVAFWHGVSALDVFPVEQCGFITHSTPQLALQMRLHGYPEGLIGLIDAQNPVNPFHALPHEYPLLTLIPYSLSLIAPAEEYQIAFAITMCLLLGVVYLLLKRFCSAGAALAFVLYISVGSLVTAVARFDILPSTLTLIALILADRSRWKWAFTLLAFATLLKFYPLIFVLPFFIAQQKQIAGKWFAWRRWSALGAFAGVSALVLSVSLILSVEGTITPFLYFGARPVQVESLTASFVWLGSFLGFPLHHVVSYGSLNVESSISSYIGDVGTVLLLVGLGYTFWLQWRGILSLAGTVLLTLLIILLTGKVFSPQYLIWASPLVAYVGQSNWKWLVSWGLIGLLTTVIYPVIYNLTANLVAVPDEPPFYPVAFVRNMLLLAVVLVLLYRASRHVVGSPKVRLSEEEDVLVEKAVVPTFLVR